MRYGRKVTGGKYHKFRKKKKFSLQGTQNKVKLRETKKKIVRTRGGYKKIILLSVDYANVIDPKNGKTKKVKINNVLETPANRFLARQNILVKSAIIDTEIGKVKITNRPSREGMINAVLME